MYKGASKKRLKDREYFKAQAVSAKFFFFLFVLCLGFPNFAPESKSNNKTKNICKTNCNN